MKAIASLAVYSGINIIHVGTPLVSDTTDIQERLEILKAVHDVNSEVIPVFTRASLEILPNLINLFGRKSIIMVCGAIRTNGKIDYRKLEHFIKEAHI